MKRNKCIILLVFILTSRRRDILKGKNDTHMHQLLCNECQNIIVCVHVIYLSSVEKILVFGKFSVSYMDTKRKVSDTFVNTYCQNVLGNFNFLLVLHSTIMNSLIDISKSNNASLVALITNENVWKT